VPEGLSLLAEGKPTDVEARRRTAAGESMNTLDEWICKGGFLPTDWAVARRLAEGNG
jgi:hypothetical protein